MKNRNLLLLLTILLIAAFALSACGGGATEEPVEEPAAEEPAAEEPAAEEPAAELTGSVGVVLPTREEPRWIQDEARFKDAFAEAGYEVEILFSEGDSAKERQNVENLITKGVQVIIICPQDATAAAAAAEAARDAGVKVISYDRLIRETDAVDYYVTFDSIAVGEAQGQYLVDKASGTGNPLYLYAGAASDNNAFLFFEGAWNVLQPKIADGTFYIVNSSEAVALQDKAELTREEMAQIIGQVTTEWDFDTAKTLAESNLTAASVDDKGDVSILAPNDGTARAIADAFAADADVSSYVVTGQDAEIASVQYIIDGKQSMTVLKDVRTLVADAISAAVAYLEGSSPPETNSYNNGASDVPAAPSVVVTVDQSNVQEEIIDSGYWDASEFTGVEEAPAAEEPMADSCEPATDGPLAGVDPRGQTVVWWHNHDEEGRLEFLDKYTAEFNATNPCGITVEHLEQGSYNDIRDKVNASIAAGELPASMVVGYQNDQAFYQLNDALVDLNDYINDPTWGLTAEELADFFPAYLEQSVHAAYGGQQLGFPPNRSMEGLIYNISWLKDLGFDGSPPETPEELREMACAAAEANGDGTGGFIIDTGASTIAAWTFAYGGNILNDDGTSYVYNGPATVDSLTFLKELYDDGCAYLYTEGYPQPPFANREALFTTSSSSGIPYYLGAVEDVAAETGNPVDEFGFGAIPHTTPDPVQNIYGGDVMITKTTPEQQLAAWLWIKYYTQPEIQAEWVKASNYFPTRASTEQYLGDYMSENPIWASAVNLLQYGIGEPQLISYQTVRDEADKAFNEILEGADVQATLDNLTEMANELQTELMEE